MVYFVIRSNTGFGKIDNFLFVCDCRDEWPSQFEDLKADEPYCYVHIHDAPEFSEIEHIGIKRIGKSKFCRVW